LTPLLVSTAVAAANSFPRECLDLAAGEPRVGCLQRALPAAPSEALPRIAGWIQQDPGAGLALLKGLEEGAEPALREDSRLRSQWLELRAEAHEALGEHAAAADEILESVRLDDGTLRLDWFRSRETAAWTSSLDTGSARLERAARILAAAGRSVEAKALRTRALALGGAVDRLAAPDDDLRPARRPVPLESLPWRETLTDLQIPLLGGRTFSLADGGFKVLVLDFWATWCQPCVRELPFLERLHAAEAEHGLKVVAVNYLEQLDVAGAFVQSLGLNLPIGMHTEAMQKAFRIESMPTVVVIDARGRVRGRWGGYEEAIEDDLSGLVRGLIAEEREPGIQLGEVLVGDGVLRAEWTHRAKRPIEGVAVAPGPEGDPRIAVARFRDLDFFSGDGRHLLTIAGRELLGRLVVGADAGQEIVSYRAGGTSVSRWSEGMDRLEAWEAPSPLFDLALVPASDAEEAKLALAGLDGLWLAGRSGTELRRIEPFAQVAGVGWVGDAATGRLWVLGTDGVLSRLDRGMNVTDRRAIPDVGWTLVTAHRLDAGAGVAPPGVRAAVTGRFLGAAGGGQVALALDSEQLVVLDLDDGSERFRARWPQITNLAAGDVDGDGRDELVVASGVFLTLVRGADAPSE